MQKLIKSLEELAISPKEEHEKILSAIDTSPEIMNALLKGDTEELISLLKIQDQIRFVGIHPADDDEEQEDQEETPNESITA